MNYWEFLSKINRKLSWSWSAAHHHRNSIGRFSIIGYSLATISLLFHYSLTTHSFTTFLTRFCTLFNKSVILRSCLFTYLLVPLLVQPNTCLYMNWFTHKFNFLYLFLLFRCEGKNVEIVADLLISGNAFVGLADDEATSGTIYTHSNRHPHM